MEYKAEHLNVEIHIKFGRGYMCIFDTKRLKLNKL